MCNFPKYPHLKRNESADSLRGLAAVLVIAGHLIVRDLERISTPNYFFSMLYCVHMPIFFFFAGLFAKSGLEKDLRQLGSEKAARLLVPYITWSSVAVVARAVLLILQGQWNFVDSLRQWVHTLLYADSMWFFLSLFTMHIFFWIVTKLWNKNHILAIVFSAICYLMPLSGFLSLHNTQCMMPYFALGLLAAHHKQTVLSFAFKKHKLLVVAAIVVFFVMPVYIVNASQWRLDEGINLIWGGMLSTLTASAVCILSESIMCKIRAVRKLFLLFGKYSMELYCIHMLFVNYFPISAPDRVIAMPEFILDIFYFILALGIGLMCVALSFVIFNRIPLYRRFMLGQWPQANNEVRK